MKRSVEDELGDLKKQLGRVADQVSRLAARSVDEVSEGVEESVEDFGEAAAERWQRVKGGAERAFDRSREMIQDKPFGSLAVGVAVGFLAGLLLRKSD